MIYRRAIERGDVAVQSISADSSHDHPQMAWCRHHDASAPPGALALGTNGENGRDGHIAGANDGCSNRHFDHATMESNGRAQAPQSRDSTGKDGRVAAVRERCSTLTPLLSPCQNFSRACTLIALIRVTPMTPSRSRADLYWLLSIAGPMGAHMHRRATCALLVFIACLK